jgi:hypothetical protein
MNANHVEAGFASRRCFGVASPASWPINAVTLNSVGSVLLAAIVVQQITFYQAAGIIKRMLQFCLRLGAIAFWAFTR